MFRKRPPRVRVELTPAEVRLLRAALLSFRSKAIAAGKPIEDINDLILMIS